LSQRKKTEIIAELNETLSILKDQENRLEAEARERAGKRNELHARMKTLRDETLELRSQRDELNLKVKELKQHRNDITAGIHERLEEIEKLREEHRALAKRKPPRSHETLQKEVESIDWTIQTTSLTLQEDKELVEKVKQLETQLAIHRKLEQLTIKIAQLRKEAKAMKSESELLHNQLTENAQKSQETHGKMLEKIEKSKALRTEADDAHKQFLQSKERIEPLQKEIKILLSQIRQLKGDMREEAQKEKKESQDALRQTLERQAKEKLKRGEKLSWEEFQLLAEKGITDQD
jgi:phosphoserine phosphatase